MFHVHKRQQKALVSKQLCVSQCPCFYSPDTTQHVRWWNQGTKWYDETRYWENNGTIICKRPGKDSFLPFEQKMHCDKHCLSRNHPSLWLKWRNGCEIMWFVCVCVCVCVCVIYTQSANFPVYIYNIVHIY